MATRPLTDCWTEGRTLRDKWQQEGTKTFLGLHSMVSLTCLSSPGHKVVAAALATNAIEEHGDYVVWMLSTMRDKASMLST